jgi:apoptosis-inducing factor 3
MPRVHAGLLDDLPRDRPVLRECGGRRLALVRLGDVVHVVDDACPHAGGPLSEGRVRGQTLVCPYHGWVWSVLDGRCVAPARDARAIVHRATVEAGQVWLELGDP